MSGSLGCQLRVLAFRQRPRAWPSSVQLQAPGQRRHFGLSEAAGYLLKGSELLVQNVHELTASPWYISIPLVALITSATIRMPLTLWSLSVARRKARLTPLIQAQTAMLGMGLRKNKSNILDLLSKATQKRNKQLFKTFGMNDHRSVWATVLSLPIFVSNIEVIRRMCGGPSGILGRLLLPSPTTDDKIATTPESSVTTMQPTESGELMASASSSGVHEVIPLEPALADGGCLWFPNLLEADPYHVLPLAISAVMMLHIIPGSIAATRDLFGLSSPTEQIAILSQSKSARAFQRTLLLLACSIGPLTMDMPAAIHLYWLSSSTTTLLISKGLMKLMPVPKNSIQPCRGAEVPLLRPKAPPKHT